MKVLEVCFGKGVFTKQTGDSMRVFVGSGSGLPYFAMEQDERTKGTVDVRGVWQHLKRQVTRFMCVVEKIQYTEPFPSFLVRL